MISGSTESDSQSIKSIWMKELLLWPTWIQSHRNPLHEGEDHTSEFLSSCGLQPPSSEGSTGAGGSASRMAPSQKNSISCWLLSGRREFLTPGPLDRSAWVFSRQGTLDPPEQAIHERTRNSRCLSSFSLESPTLSISPHFVFY